MTVALVLSGGGSKGDFELGAIRFLYDNGLQPDIICGTSVGAINGAKLAEGNNPTNPSQGLSGLELIWEALRTSGDMYVDGPWLATVGSDVRDVVDGRSPISVLGPAGPSWFQKAVWAVGSAGPILSDLRKVTSFPALFDATPIRARIDSLLDPGKIGAWGAGGRRLRIAIVGLNSGRLRYVTERSPNETARQCSHQRRIRVPHRSGQCRGRWPIYRLRKTSWFPPQRGRSQLPCEPFKLQVVR